MFSRSFNHRPLDYSAWLKVRSELMSKYGMVLAVKHLASQDINPGFRSIYDEVTFEKLYQYLEKHGQGVKKYEVGIFRRRRLFGKLHYKDQVGWITVRLHKVNASAGDCYPSIDLVLFELNKVWWGDMRNRILASIVGLLELTETDQQRISDTFDLFRSSIKDQTLLDECSGAFGRGNYDLAVTAATGMVEKELKSKIVACGGTVGLSDTGPELARIAFHNENGILLPPYPLAAQACHGVFLIHQGLFLYLRNAFAHSKVLGDDGPMAVLMIKQCEFCLGLIRGSTKR